LTEGEVADQTEDMPAELVEILERQIQQGENQPLRRSSAIT
jgi:hypothetical protein